MKIAIVGDLHLADNPPSLRIDDYREAILNKLDFILMKACAEQAVAVCFLGDIFHKKIPNHNSHFLIKRIVEICSKYDVPKYTIPGNHDISGTEENLGKQPLSVLDEINAIHFLRNDEFIYFNEDSKFSLGLFGKSFSTDRDNPKNMELYLPADNNADIVLGLFHQMILPDSQSFFDNYLNFSDFDRLPIDVIAVGHYHGGFDPALQKVGSQWFLNPGAVSRGSSDETTMNRKPKFTILNVDFESGTKLLSSYDIDIPVESAELVFDTNKVERRKELSKLKEFVNQLSSIELETSEVTTEFVVRLLKKFGMPERLEPLATKYLEGNTK